MFFIVAGALECRHITGFGKGSITFENLLIDLRMFLLAEYSRKKIEKRKQQHKN